MEFKTTETGYLFQIWNYRDGEMKTPEGRKADYEAIVFKVMNGRMDSRKDTYIVKRLGTIGLSIAEANNLESVIDQINKGLRKLQSG